MKCGLTTVKILHLLVPFLGTTNGDLSVPWEGIDIDIEHKKSCYRVEFSEDVWPCADFDNTVMKCDPLELGTVEGKDELGLQGEIKLDAQIEDGISMNVEVWKVTDVGNEYMYHAQGDICGSLKDANTPWFPLVDAMKITECPIAVKTYTIKDMILDLSAANDFLTHEMCGGYVVELSMTTDVNEKISCYGLGVAVSEYTCDKSEE